MYLFFDTETTGLPKNWRAPITDSRNWPRLVQLAYLLYDDAGNKMVSGDHIVKPQNFVIPADAAKVHGITTERANREGEDLVQVLIEFQSLVERTDYLVAHNLSFDEKIIGAELFRNNLSDGIAFKNKICTMVQTTDFCSIPGPYGYKWPTLTELHYKLFRTGFTEAHNAITDIAATARCFWELRRIKKI